MTMICASKARLSDDDISVLVFGGRKDGAWVWDKTALTVWPKDV